VSDGSTPLAADFVTASLEDKVAALRSPLAYDEWPKTISAIETHFAWVFLTDDHAFKLKKPVCTAYLDLSTVSARRFNCSEEFRLNQRLAPGVYLDVVPLTMDTEGAFRVGGGGVVVDWLVKMRRLPAALMLDCAMAADRVPVEQLAAVGRMLARFYRVQQCMGFDPRDYVARIRSQMEQDRSDLLAPELNITVALVESVAAAQASACDKAEPELMLRAQQRRIVEGHGDLRPEHICLTDPPCIIDSLEFSLDLRTLDPGEELAFLSVECERLGDVSPAERVLTDYRTESNDPITSQLLDFYRSRRATVRAKLVAWHLRDPAFSERADWRAQAEGYLQLARLYAVRVFRGDAQRC
jgi:aminoglycoside phosphotransferase family enzyme